MIHPNRTYLLQQKAKRLSVNNSLHILKARRQALIAELMASARPFLLSRKEIASRYQKAIEEIQLSLAKESRPSIASISALSEHNLGIKIEQRNILGVRYKEVVTGKSSERRKDRQQYDIGSTSPHLEEAIANFEGITEQLLKMASIESKLKKLSREIKQLSRKSRVLEQRIIPKLNDNLRIAAQYISEREREDYYRLKRFKDIQKR